MKRAILLVLLFSSSYFCLAQFYIIDDPDGYTNIRDQSKNIVATIDDNYLIGLYEDDNTKGYISIDALWKIPNTFTRYGSGEEGGDDSYEGENRQIYIHSSRLKSLDKLPQLKKIEVNPNKVICYNDENQY